LILIIICLFVFAIFSNSFKLVSEMVSMHSCNSITMWEFLSKPQRNKSSMLLRITISTSPKTRQNTISWDYSNELITTINLISMTAANCSYKNERRLKIIHLFPHIYHIISETITNPNYQLASPLGIVFFNCFLTK